MQLIVIILTKLSTGNATTPRNRKDLNFLPTFKHSSLFEYERMTNVQTIRRMSQMFLTKNVKISPLLENLKNHFVPGSLLILN